MTAMQTALRGRHRLRLLQLAQLAPRRVGLAQSDLRMLVVAAVVALHLSRVVAQFDLQTMVPAAAAAAEAATMPLGLLQVKSRHLRQLARAVPGRQ